MADRPLLVAIISLLTMLSGICSVILGVLAFTGIDLGFEQLTDIMGMIGGSGLIGGLIVLLIGYAIWSGWSIAWYVAIIIYAIAVLAMLVFLVFGITLIGALGAVMIIPLVICIVILYYLFRPNVKAFFKI